MKVIVTAVSGGYFGDVRRRYEDVFMIPDTPRRTPTPKEAVLPVCKEVMDKAGTVPEAFSSRWMRKAPKGTPEKVSTAPRQVLGNLTIDGQNRVIGGDGKVVGAAAGAAADAPTGGDEFGGGTEGDVL